MASNKHKQQKKNAKHTSQKTKATLEIFFAKHLHTVFYVSLLISSISSLVLFDMKIGVGGDDSEYIKRAYDLIHDGAYPAFQGPLYPMLLSVFIMLFGMNMFVLKFLSFLFVLGGNAALYFALRRRVSAVILSFVLLLLSVNAMLLFFASQTYVEAFFFLMLNLTLLFYLDFSEQENDTFINKTNLKSFLLVGGMIFLLGLTKTVGIAFLLIAAFALTLQKHWKRIGGLVAVYVGFSAVWALLKRLFWSYDKLQFSDQANTLLLKNPYVPAQGQEDLLGFLERFYVNSGLYFSKHLYAFFNLREITSDPVLVLTIASYILVIGGFILIARHNKTLLFVGLLASGMMGISFIALQPIWDTPRLVVPFLPLLVLFILGAFYESKNAKVKPIAGKLVPVAMLVLLLTTFGGLVKEGKKDRAGLRNYIAGNKLEGYTPDWVNYIKMSQWAAKNIPDSVTIACRKPSISFLYTGRKYFGIFRIPMHNDKQYFHKLDSAGTKYVIIDESKFSQLKLPWQVLEPWKIHLDAIYAGSVVEGENEASRFYGVYKLDSPQAIAEYEALKVRGVGFIDNANSLMAELSTQQPNMNIIDPDELLQQLKDRNARYVIMANLRKFEAQKTRFTINTIRRYMFYVQHKYPRVLTQVSEVGMDEKAYLFKVDF